LLLLLKTANSKQSIGAGCTGGPTRLRPIPSQLCPPAPLSQPGSFIVTGQQCAYNLLTRHVAYWEFVISDWEIHGKSAVWNALENFVRCL